MRIFSVISVLFFSFSLSAQTVNNILFTKGAELEYQTFSSRPKNFTKLELYEVTRITLVITDVKDSNGVVYSYITKKGKGIMKPDQDHYEKKYVLTLEKNKIKIPKDLYTVDTVYLADRYPDLKKAKGYHAVSVMNESSYTIYENDPDNAQFSYSSKSDEIKIISKELTIDNKMRPGDEIFFGGTLRKTEYTLVASLIDIKNEGKATIKLKAGNFNCYKLMVTNQVKVKGLRLVRLAGPMESNMVVYYDSQIGFLKTGQADAKTQTGYMELIRLKR